MSELERQSHPDGPAITGLYWVVYNPDGSVREQGYGKKYGERTFNGIPIDADEVLVVETQINLTS